MARCPVCESDVPDGRPACDACGLVLNKALTTAAAPNVVHRTIEAARRELVASASDPADVAFPRGLL